MTEDMRERFETFVTTQMLDSVARDAEGQYRNHDVKFAENIWKAAWQAALSSAGTSGTFDGNDALLVGSRGDQAREAFQAQLNHRGDSLSGKGKATKKCPNCGGEIVSTVHGFYCPKPMCKWGWETEMDGSPLQPPSAPDRAEELARKCADTIKAHETSYAQRESDLWRWACTCGKMETVDSRDACVSATQHHWGQAVASLLREASDECPTCGLTIVPRLCANPACASSVAPPREGG